MYVSAQTRRWRRGLLVPPVATVLPPVALVGGGKEPSPGRRRSVLFGGGCVGLVPLEFRRFISAIGPILVSIIFSHVSMPRFHV